MCLCSQCVRCELSHDWMLLTPVCAVFVFTVCRMWVQPWLNATHTSLCCAVCVLPVWQMWSVCVLPVCKMWARSGWTLLTFACALCVCVCLLPVWQMWAVSLLPVCDVCAKSGWTLLTFACAVCCLCCVCVCVASVTDVSCVCVCVASVWCMS